MNQTTNTHGKRDPNSYTITAMIPFSELNTQFKEIEAEVRAAIDEVLASGWYVLGQQVAAFEAEFAAYLGVRHVVGVGSGTDAIQLALVAAGVKAGSEVVTAPNTCVPTVAAISATGATPVFADVDAHTLTLSPEKLETAITVRTRAIVPVHLYGHPCDMGPLERIAAERNIPLIEDCAQAHGTLYKGNACGGFGRAAAFSFYPSKNLGAFGDGGAVATNDDAMAEQVRMLRNYGEEKRYHHRLKGFNSRLDELQAAILRVKLKYLDQWNNARRDLAGQYLEVLGDLPLALPREAGWARHNYHLFVVRSPERDELAAHLEEKGIRVLQHYPIPVHRQAAYADLELGPGTYPIAEKACRQVLSLPLYPELPRETLARIANAIKDFYR